MDKIKIGWSEVDFSPKKGTKISLAGQFYERITDEIESPVTATAFALECGNDQMIICSCDLVSIGDNLNELVKENVCKQIDIDPNKIIISAIHTHTSYVYSRSSKVSAESSLSCLKRLIPEDMQYVPLVSNEECMSPVDSLNLLVEKISQAIVEAWNNRSEGYYQNAFGRAVVGHCRRVCYDDGSAAMWGDTNSANFTELEAGNDSGIELIYTFDKDKNLNGVIANVACPAQVVEQRSFISSDYWGKVKENLEKHFGKKIFVLGLISAAGDQCPRDMIRWVNPETPIDDPNVKRENYIERRQDPSMYDISGLKVVGKRISNEIISVFEELDDNKIDSSVLQHKTINLSLPLRRVTKAEYNQSIKEINDFIDKNRGKKITFEDNAKLHIYAGNIVRFEKQQTLDLFDIEVHFVKFGDVAFATNPFELFLDYGNQIRARSKAKQTFLIQLSCGVNGYLPTEKAEKGSHYSAYVSSGWTGHEGGDILVRTTLEQINKMF